MREKFKSLLRDRAGFSPESIKDESLIRHTGALMDELGLRTHLDLYNHVSRDEKGFSAFVQRMTVNETFFFREPVYLKVFIDRIIPDVLKSASGVIRVLSAGCSTGEEAYTLAIMLMEKYGAEAARRFEVLGLDIDSTALEVAREGIYGTGSFRGYENDQVMQYFEPTHDGRLMVAPEVRSMVSFKFHNLIDDRYPVSGGNVWVVFYRNVSIYLTAEAQGRILAGLAGVLNPGGYLVVASSETFSHNINILHMVEFDGIFMFRKEAREEDAPAKSRRTKSIGLEGATKRLKDFAWQFPPERPYTLAPEAKPLARALTGDALFDEAYKMYCQGDYDFALQGTELLLEAGDHVAEARLMRGGICLRREDYKGAAKEISLAIAQEEMSLEAYLMAGVAMKHGERPEWADEYFHKAVHIEPYCWIAHYYLGEIYSERGDRERAMGRYEKARSILKRGRHQGLNLKFFNLPYKSEQFIHICENKIIRLGGK